MCMVISDAITHYYFIGSVHLSIAALLHIHQCHCFVPQIGEAALMWASSRGHSDAIKVLLSAGAQIDLQDKVRRSICVLQTPGSSL